MNHPERGDSPEVEAHLAQAQSSQKKAGKIVLIVVGVIAAVFFGFWIWGKLAGGGPRLDVPGRTATAAPATTVPDSPITR